MLVTVLLIAVPAFMFFDDQGCIVTIVVLFLFGGCILAVGVGTGTLIFPFVKGILASGAVCGVVAAIFGLAVEALRHFAGST